MKQAISTPLAPRAIGPYSQAIKAGQTIYLSGQIPLDPDNMTLVADDITAQAHQVFKNLQSVTLAAGGALSDIVRLSIYLTDLTQFNLVNDVMTQYFTAPYPARTTIEVAGLPKDAKIEVDAIMVVHIP